MREQITCADIAQAIVVVAASLMPFHVNANCWNNPSLTRFAEQIATRHFPALQGRMPEIIECDASEFGPNIGGDYTSGVHRIRIPVWQRGQPMESVRTTIAHELAHAVLEGRDWSGPNGHGTAFFRVLINAGFAAETQRVAGIYGNFEALAQAGAQTPPPAAGPWLADAQGAAPPAAPQAPLMQWVTVCHTRPITYPVYLPHRRAMQYVTEMRQFCRQVLR